MKTISTLSTQEDAVIHFIEMLDIDMINTLLDEGKTYQDMEKYLFIRKLGYAFDEFLESGDTFLQTKKGNCEAVTCNFKCKGYYLEVNKTRFMYVSKRRMYDGHINDIHKVKGFTV